MDFIKQIACMISESTDTPSYDDIFTLCKMAGKEPDEDTMGPEEYNQLTDAEKEEIHEFVQQFGQLDFSKQDVEAIKNYIGPSDINLDLDTEIERDENGQQIGWEQKKKEMMKSKRAATADDFKNSLKKVTYVFVAENIAYFNPQKQRIEDIDDPTKFDEYQKIDRKKSWKKIGTLKFPTETQAKEWCEKRINDRCKQLGLDRSDFKEGHDFLPSEIKQADPGAIGYSYLKLFGDGAVELGKRGRKSKNPNADTTKDVRFETLEREVRLEYIIYESSEVIKSSGKALNDLFGINSDDK